MIPNEAFMAGQQIKIFDSFEESWWDSSDIEDWDTDDDDIFGILGKILTIKEVKRLGNSITIKTKEGYNVYQKDVEYIVSEEEEIQQISTDAFCSMFGGVAL